MLDRWGSGKGRKRMRLKGQIRVTSGYIAEEISYQLKAETGYYIIVDSGLKEIGKKEVSGST